MSESYEGSSIANNSNHHHHRHHYHYHDRYRYRYHYHHFFFFSFFFFFVQLVQLDSQSLGRLLWKSKVGRPGPFTLGLHQLQIKLELSGNWSKILCNRGQEEKFSEPSNQIIAQ